MIPALSEALSERGYDVLTAVQEAVGDPALADRDLLVSAQTGSGKTVAFGLAIAPTLLGDAARFGPAGAPLGLVIAPTRELALQVKSELDWLYGNTGAVIASAVGGMDIRTERRALERGAHIVVGTPGRLRDHIEREALLLDDIRAVVLDEADEMLDLGFREDLEYMLGEAPETRRTLLFSATVPPMIATLAQTYQRDAERISTVDKGTQHADIAYQAVRVNAADTEHAIFNLLRYHHDASAIVFANTRAAVNHLSARLTNRGLSTVSLSGELSQTERTHALQAMRDGRARVCVATDVAARGIDLPNLTLVIHADLPSNTESLLHRSGRTGRAGRKGISALIVPPRAMGKATRILKWAKITAEWTEAPSAEAILQADEDRLLTDPAWDLPLEEDEAAFAEKLMARHAPEKIAGAFLRLARKGHAAPEELREPDAPAPRAEKRPSRDFGPSRWVSLSVGRKDRAEARWLLPLLCNAGGLDKDAIGAIRVQEDRTYVELAEASVDGFTATLGDGGALEDGVTAELLAEAPDLSQTPRPAGPAPRRNEGPRRPDGPQAGKPGGAKPRGEPWEHKPRGPRPVRDDRPRSDKPGKPRPADRPARPHGGKPSHADSSPPRDRATDAPKSRWSKPADDAPRPARKADRDDRPAPKGFKPGAGKPYKGKREDERPARDGAPGDKRGFKGKPGGKPFGKDRKAGRSNDAPVGDAPRGKGGGKPFGKPFGKPGGKTGGKSGGKPAPRASDTSKRFTPPGKAGSAPPRRKG